MNRKYKILITGKNKAIIDDIFGHTTADFECLSTSRRTDDVMAHLKYFQPDAFVYCLKAEETEDINNLKLVGPKMHQSYIPFVIIGDQADCNEFQKQAYNTVDLVLTRPITLTSIHDKISDLIREWQQKKLIDGAKKAELSDTGTELPDIDEEKPESAMDVLKELTNELNQETENVVVGEKRGHILVVDDDPRMLKVIRANLRDEYDVASAVNGRLALKFLEKKKTDLILLDYEMPGLKGPEVFRILKSSPELSAIPVVFLTGVGELSKVQEVLEMKPQGYLLKPVDRSKLRTCVQNLLG